jgi:hypothetical protein
MESQPTIQSLPGHDVQPDSPAFIQILGRAVNTESRCELFLEIMINYGKAGIETRAFPFLKKKGKSLTRIHTGTDYLISVILSVFEKSLVLRV